MEGLRETVKATRRLISATRRTQFERCLIRGEDVRTLILNDFYRIYPEATEWQDSEIFKFNQPQLPVNLRHREKELFKSALGAIEKGPETTPTIQALHLVESRVREHALLVHALGQKLASGGRAADHPHWDGKPLARPIHDAGGGGGPISL